MAKKLKFGCKDKKGLIKDLKNVLVEIGYGEKSEEMANEMAQFSFYIDDLFNYVETRKGIDKFFDAISKPVKGERESAIQFVKECYSKIPDYMQQRQKLAEEYAKKRKDIPEKVKAFVGDFSKHNWQYFPESILKKAGFDYKEISQAVK